jgi:hypothetical protein
MNTREAGTCIYGDTETDRVLAYPTVQCVHCQMHFPLKPPKAMLHPLTPMEAEFLEQQGKVVRGFCQNCSGYVCGPACAACVPAEIMLENMEKGRPDGYRPICVPTSIPKGL